MNRRIPFSFLVTGSAPKRLWLGGIGLALFMGTLVAANAFIPSERAVTPRLLGLDFSAFYTAGTFVADGRLGDLYSLDAIRAFQQRLAADYGLPLGESIGPWWNPPFYAWVFVPLAGWSYPDALLGWMGINALCAIAAALLLARLLVVDVLRTWRLSGDSDDGGPERFTPRPDPSWRTWVLVPLLLVVSMPFIGTITHGQSGGTSLLLMTLIVLAWRADQAMLAGLLCGLLFYKPQLAAVVAGVLVLSLGIKAALGLLCTGVGLIVLTILTLPGTLSDFVLRMPLNLQHMQEAMPYLWDRHATWLAFWRLLIQGDQLGPTGSLPALLAIQCGLVLGGGLVIVAMRAWKRHGSLTHLSRMDQRLLRQIQLDRLIAASLLCMPLIMPFYFDYDLILLAIPATLMAREVLIRQAHGSAMGDAARINLRLWTALFICLMISPHVAAWTRVNPTVPLLAVLAMVSLWRAGKRVAFDQSAVPVIPATPVLVRRAA